MGSTLALPSFKHQFGLTGLSTAATNTLSSNIVITFQAGCLLACFLALPSAEILGRRMTLILASVIFLIGASIQLTGQLGSFYAGRFLTGLGIGPMSVVCPLYLSEIAPGPIRGRLIGIFDIMYQFAALIGFWINFGVALHVSDASQSQWRIPVAVQIPLCGLLLISCFFLPETPRFLVKQDKSEQAQKVLSLLRNLSMEHEYVQTELRDIQIEVQIEQQMMGNQPNQSYWTTIKSRVSDCLQPGIPHRISVSASTQQSILSYKL